LGDWPLFTYHNQFTILLQVAQTFRLFCVLRKMDNFLDCATFFLSIRVLFGESLYFIRPSHNFTRSDRRARV